MRVRGGEGVRGKGRGVGCEGEGRGRGGCEGVKEGESWKGWV